jgi:hypothetical protein
MPLARLVPVLVLGWLSLGKAAAQECESYFVLVFAGHNKPNLPRDTHCFATFVKVTCEPGEPVDVEHHTISWMPVSMEVRVLKWLPEPGHNLTLGKTLEMAHEQGLQLSLFGPYEIKPGLYERSVTQGEKLRSGCVQYKTCDTGYLSTKVSNCVHAVADLAYPFPHPRIGSLGWGEAASRHVVMHLRPYLIDPKVTHDWLIDALGLADCSILRRSYSKLHP